MNMKQTYSEEDLKRILSNGNIESDVIDQKMEEAFNIIRSRKNSKKKGIGRKIAYGFGTAAAVFILAFTLCVANPALAANIPFFGSIFEMIQDVFSFGRIPEEEITKLEGQVTTQKQKEEPNEGSDGIGTEGKDVVESNSETGNGGEITALYQASDKGITFTITEYYASNQAVFLGFIVENEEEFPEQLAVAGETGYQWLQVSTIEKCSFRDDLTGGYQNIEGKLEDPHTFIGVMRIDYDSINLDESVYDEAYEKAEKAGEELPEVNSETWDMYMKRYEVPDKFQMELQIDFFQGYCTEKISEETGNRYKVKGNWKFPILNIEKSTADIKTIQINEVNEDGIGVEYIELSPVELTLHIMEPTDRLLFAVAVDKNGKQLVGGSSDAYVLSTNGCDVSEVTVYIFDYDEYMDKKQYTLEKEGDELIQVLEEYALFKTCINTR